MNSKKIAISAVSASLIAVVLIIGSYIAFLDLVCIIISSLFVLLPLYKQTKIGAFLSYIVGGLIAFMSFGFNIYSIVCPAYFAFFGIYPIVRHILQEKNINKYLLFIIGAIWFVLVLYGIFFYYTLVMGLQLFSKFNWLSNNLVYILGAVGVLVFFLYDRYIYLGKIVVARYLDKIIK